MFWWLAEYRDGTIVRQYDGDIRVSADEIDRDQLKIFSLMYGGACIVKLHIQEGEKLVYRRRVEKNIGGPETVCHIVGCRKYVGDGEITQSTIFVFEDGSIEMISDFQENHPWFYEPKLRDFELPWQ